MQIQLATLTQKGQITIPYEMRRFFGMKPYSKVTLSMTKKTINIEPTLDILDIAPLGKAPKGMNALKAREYMQTHYKRI